MANQRTKQTFTAGNYMDYTYDNLGELRTAKGKESDGVQNRGFEQLDFAYDAAGNLNYRTNNQLVQTFNANSLNELTTVNRSGTLHVAGTTTSAATNVTVNGQAAAIYDDFTFAKGGFTLVDGTNTFTAIAKDAYGRVDTNTVTVNLPATNSFAYDLNGNMLTNGNEVMIWNDANQLVTNFVAGVWKSEFVYDGKLRRRIERDYGWNGSSWTLTNEVRLIYDGNVIIQHRDANNLPTLTLTRGNDLSGGLQGAGGIGGLLAMTESSGTHSYYHADGNGNVTCLINTNQLVAGRYLYDPFGNTLSISGPKALINRYRYCSKPIHELSGDYDFLFRWYSPNLQRWLNRDPLGETGGLNLYAFIGNNAGNAVDPDGDSEHNTVSVVTAPWVVPRQYSAPPREYPPGTPLLSQNNESGVRRDTLSGMGAGGVIGTPLEKPMYDLTMALITAPLPVPCKGALAAKTGATLADDLAAAATRARNTVGPGSGGAYGTRVHTAFEAEVQGLNQGLSTEISYLNGNVVPRGTPGSVRLDVVNGPLNAPVSIFDLKTGSATLTPARIQQIQSHIPGSANVPVFPVRP